MTHRATLSKNYRRLERAVKTGRKLFGAHAALHFAREHAAESRRVEGLPDYYNLCCTGHLVQNRHRRSGRPEVRAMFHYQARYYESFSEDLS